MPVKTYSKLPLPVQAIQFTYGADIETVREIIEFTDEKFRIVPPSTSIIKAEVYDELHDTWVGVKNGDFIIKGVKGEFYPHDGDLFPQAYIESWQQEAFEIFNETPPSRE